MSVNKYLYLLHLLNIASALLKHSDIHLQYLFEGGLKEAVAHFVPVAVTLGQILEAGDTTLYSQLSTVSSLSDMIFRAS